VQIKAKAKLLRRIPNFQFSLWFIYKFAFFSEPLSLKYDALD